MDEPKSKHCYMYSIPNWSITLMPKTKKIFLLRRVLPFPLSYNSSGVDKLEKTVFVEKN